MQLSSRKTIIGLSLLLSAAPALAARSRAECVRDRASELADLAACGDKLNIAICLEDVKPDKEHCNSVSLAQCFVDAGCSGREAHIEAEWTVKRCDERPDADFADFSDLRRRQAGKDDDENPPPPPATKNPAPKASPSPAAKEEPKKPEDKKQAATPAPAPAATPNPKPAETPTPAPVPAQAQTTSPANPTGNVVINAEGKTLVCSVPSDTIITNCPIVSTGPESGKTLPCSTTATQTLVCAPNHICRENGCMIKEGFGTAGIIIAIAMGAFIAIAIGATCFFCCRERNQQKRLEKAAEAAAIAKAAAADKKRPSVAVRNVSGGGDAAPLMGGAPPMPGSNPFGDGHMVR